MSKIDKTIKWIIRSDKSDPSNPYVMVDKRYLREKHLSPRDKYIFTVILALPDYWVVNTKDISKRSGVNQRMCNDTFKTLRELGYMTRNEDVIDRKSHYTVYEDGSGVDPVYGVDGRVSKYGKYEDRIISK